MSKLRFKVGDRVIKIKKAHRPNEVIKVGSVGTILAKRFLGNMDGYTYTYDYEIAYDNHYKKREVVGHDKCLMKVEN